MSNSEHKLIADRKFMNYHIKVRSSLSEQQLHNFKLLKSNRDRIIFVANIPNRPAFPIDVQINRGKNLQEAKRLKDQGNAYFQKESYNMAFALYSQALLKSSENTSEFAKELPVFYANRSAALYHLQKYDLSIKDADLALKKNYPRELKYKVLDRKARCYLALEKHQLAEELFRQTVSALDDAKLPPEKRQKWQKDIQIMLLMMQKNKRQVSAAEVVNNKSRKYLGSPVIKGKRNPKYDSMASNVVIEYCEELGRHAVAKTDIRVGEVVLMEDPHCSVLLPAYRDTNCHLCFDRVELLHPCPTCDQVIFCSEVCARTAISSFHGTECPILSNMWESEISVTCVMALRIITQKKLRYFLDKKLSIMNVSHKEPCSNPKSSDYEFAYNLVTHESRRKPEDLLNRTLMALFLLECLKRTSYFGGCASPQQDVGLTDDEIYVCELLLHNLQLLQFNAHEVSEVKIPNDDVDKATSEFIGAALYPTLALFNHSCNPAVIRYFQGTRVIAVTVRNVKAGEKVGENYGPLFQETPREERRLSLEKQYWFHCTCDACTLDWPTLSQMNNLKDIKLRCSNKKCNNAMNIDPNASHFIIKCNVCSQNVNMIKALSALQDTDGQFAVAKSFMNVTNPKKALMEFLKIMNLLDEYLALPYKDYFLCQQAIRTCFLLLGNVYKCECK